MNSAANRITYTPWLNADGTIEIDLTVSKLAEDRFMVVVTDTMHRHTENWLRRHIPEDAHAFVTDMTSAYAQLNIQGPRSRARCRHGFALACGRGVSSWLLIGGVGGGYQSHPATSIRSSSHRGTTRATS